MYLNWSCEPGRLQFNQASVLFKGWNVGSGNSQSGWCFTAQLLQRWSDLLLTFTTSALFSSSNFYQEQYEAGQLLSPQLSPFHLCVCVCVCLHVHTCVDLIKLCFFSALDEFCLKLKCSETDYMFGTLRGTINKKRIGNSEDDNRLFMFVFVYHQSYVGGCLLMYL